MCQTNGAIWDIAARGNTLYFAGIFTQVRPAGAPLGDPASQDRNSLAACDANTGAILAFDPNPTATVAANLSIETLAFSPDGRTLVFSVTRAGNSDIYAYDIASKTTRRRSV